MLQSAWAVLPVAAVRRFAGQGGQGEAPWTSLKNPTGQSWHVPFCSSRPGEQLTVTQTRYSNNNGDGNGDGNSDSWNDRKNDSQVPSDHVESYNINDH